MPYDLALDLATGDLVFGPQRDLQGASGDGLTKQRIFIRCKIPQGTFAFDEDGNLGSQLFQIHSYPTDRQLREAPTLVQQALEPMEDIEVGEVDASVNDAGQLIISIKYNDVPASDDETEEFPPDETPEFTTDLTID